MRFILVAGMDASTLANHYFQNGHAPPIPPHIAGALTECDEFDSDSESTTVEGISEMEEVVPVEFEVLFAI